MMAFTFTELYLLSFVTGCFALGAWHILGTRRFVSGAALPLISGGLAGMTTALASTPGDWSPKLFVLARDLLLQAAAAYAIGLLRTRPKLLVALIASLGIAYLAFFREEQAATVQSATTHAQSHATSAIETSKSSLLDPNGEYIVLAETAAAREQLEASLTNEGISFTRAFKLETPIESPSAEHELLANALMIDVDAAREQDWLKRTIAEQSTQLYLEENELIAIPSITRDNAPQRQRVDSEVALKTLVGPLRPEDIGLDDPFVTEQWSLTAWPYAAFAKTTTVLRAKLQPATLFVLDSGVDAKHPDLQANYVSHLPASDKDVVGHGTHVAGIAAATANNRVGTAGWFPSGEHPVKVSSIRVINPLGFATQEDIVQGILDAATAGAAVINLSLGGPSSDRRQRVYETAVRYANERGTIVVVAAGNSATDARRYAPANTPGVIAVAALNNQLQQAVFSNDVDGLEYGVWAPGDFIMSTVPNGGYIPFSGTSMAAPQVAGLLTVAKALRPSLTTREAYQLLMKHVQPKAAGSKDAPDVVDPGGFLDAVGRG